MQEEALDKAEAALTKLWLLLEELSARKPASAGMAPSAPRTQLPSSSVSGCRAAGPSCAGCSSTSPAWLLKAPSSAASWQPQTSQV